MLSATAVGITDRWAHEASSTSKPLLLNLTSSCPTILYIRMTGYTKLELTDFPCYDLKLLLLLLQYDHCLPPSVLVEASMDGCDSVWLA